MTDPKTIEWDPHEWDPIGECVVCGNPVYPANPYEMKRGRKGAPVAHKGCGW